MDLYNNPSEYAKVTYMTLQQAQVRCEHFLNIMKEIHEAKKCPKCGQHTLELEDDSYEDNIKAYIYCDNDQIPVVEDGEEYMSECDFTSKSTNDYPAVSFWYDFDIVFAFATDIKEHGLQKTEKEIGCTWFDFVENDNKKLSK